MRAAPVVARERRILSQIQVAGMFRKEERVRGRAGASMSVGRHVTRIRHVIRIRRETCAGQGRRGREWFRLTWHGLPARVS